MMGRHIDDDGDYDYDYDDRIYEDPPLYPVGRLAAMTLDQLKKEAGRQCDRQGRLGDAEHIDDRAVEECDMRYQMVEAEIKRRLSAPSPEPTSGVREEKR